MVGLSDIPCVGKIVDRISDATVEALFRGLKYMFCYKALVEVLDSEIKKVNTEEVRVSNKAAGAKADGKIIYDDVIKWQTDMEEFHKRAEEFTETYKNRSSWRCIKCLPIPNPVSRFQLGREAVQKAKRVIELIDSGTKILANEIAYFPRVENLPKNDTEFQDFQSRKDAYGKLWEALVSEDSTMILGMYGMPGVGKTLMMEQLWKEAMKKGIFNNVTRANVSSEKLDVIDIQNQIAGHLNCHFESENNVDRRASQLKSSLMNGGNILVILDDVWREIPLDIIGISFADGSKSRGCKILLTSREEVVCLRNKCEHPVKITPLTIVEAWDLFSYTVGAHKIDSLLDESLAKKVCDKCAGLPLVITVVGKALKFMPHNSWKDALDQLEKCEIKSVPGITAEVYACLKLSFDYLEEDAKPCLLLISLFPEDDDIPIKKLIQLATFSHLVGRGTSRVHAMLDILKSSSLLLEGTDDKHFKLHDIIRDLARSIAVGDPKYAFLSEYCGSRLPDNEDYGTRKLLHLVLENNDFHFPDDLVCPDLHTLALRSTQPSLGYYDPITVEILSGGMFVNLRSVLLENFGCKWQLCLQPLGKLRTLFLDNCDISKTDVSFFPTNLETLCIRKCSHPEPLVLPTLKYLKKLEISLQGNCAVILPRNTISSLSSLEELHIRDGFMIWDGEVLEREPILDEISKLTRLKTLHILLRYDEPCQDRTIFSNLLKYNIALGRKRNRLPAVSRVFQLMGDLTLEGFEILMERAEIVRLFDSSVKLGIICNINRETYSDLRDLYISSCDNMEYVARISQDEIQQSHQWQPSFSKLTSLKIDSCYEIEYLFCKSVAKCLVQLQELYIEDCPSMEAIIMHEGTSSDGGDFINFSKLKSLKLLKLSSLTRFYREKKVMHSSSALFDRMVGFPSLEELELKELESTSDIWGKHYYDDKTVSSFCKLKSLKVSDCHELEIVIPLAILHRLHNLKNLGIECCNRLGNVFIGEGEQEITDGIIVFPELTNLILSHLPNFTNFGCYHKGEANACKVGFPKLVDFNLKIGEINLEAIDLGRDDSSCQLTSLDISFDNEIQLPCAWQLRVRNLETLALRHCWWHEQKSLSLQRLKVLKVHDSGCSTLFAFSDIGSLQLLEELELSNCALLEEIVEDVRGDKPSAMDKKTITLFHLRSVILIDLPKLKSFINGANYDSNFPALKKVKVENCGLSTLFPFSAVGSLQQLKKIEISNCAFFEEIVEDVRGEPSGMDKKTITLFHLSSVILEDLPNLKSLINDANYECNLPALKKVKVMNCGLSTLFSFRVFGSLQQLKELKILNCAFLVEIVADVRGGESLGMDKKTIRLFPLSSVIIADSPNLKKLFSGANYDCELPSLKEVEVDNCGLSTIFTCSVFRNLEHLQKLQVSNCRLLEDIVKDVRGDETSETNYNIITLFRLSEVVLRDLPNLKSFSRTESYAFIMPNLYSFCLQGCPQVETFTSLKTSTNVFLFYSDWKGRENVGDLNEYIRRNRRRSDSACESSSSNEELQTESERNEDEQPHKESVGE